MNKPLVLIVEDDPVLRRATSRILKKEFEITMAANGQEAISMILESSFDAILCDIDMPVMNGDQLFKELLLLDEKKVNSIIFLTGGTLRPAACKVLNKTGFIRKPVKTEKLIELIKQVISND